MHCSGKQEVADILENNGVKCGRLFTNVENTSNIYNGLNYEKYTTKDISEIFENNAYIFMQEYPSDNDISFVNTKYYEGLSLYEFENNDVFVLSPNHLFVIIIAYKLTIAVKLVKFSVYHIKYSLFL